MAELGHECGIAAVYHLSGQGWSRLTHREKGSGLPAPDQTALHIPRLLLEIQNRGQLAAGMTRFRPGDARLLDTHKDVGTVTEVFQLNHESGRQLLQQRCAGLAAIGHVRYATCGGDDGSLAQPFERQHIEKSKWFAFGFNGQLANYPELREEILSQRDFHLQHDVDTEVLMHLISRELSGDKKPTLFELISRLNSRLDGAYNIVYLNALGDMLVARDPLGIRPLCYAIDGPLFAAASESVALANLGFAQSEIHSLDPGCAIIIEKGELTIRRYAPAPRTAHCFFEWIYFANVASTLDERSVYLTRKRLGEELARQERLTIDGDTIVVPVPDTAKAAADAMAYSLKVPCLEGLIRNRYVGRTFIEGSNRADKVRLKYTPLTEVLENKRVILVEDTIVRSTTMKALISQIRDRGRAREVHVRVACPPIIAPCFYGIDMSTIGELFAPQFLERSDLTPDVEERMAMALGADSLRYLSLEAISRSLDLPPSALCQACLDGRYPTPAGERLYQLALDNIEQRRSATDRTYDVPAVKS
jgi:amidophosphoribosyltransferase